MNLWEALKKPFLKDYQAPEEKKLSADVAPQHNLSTLSDDPTGGALVFSSDNPNFTNWGFGDEFSQFDYQNSVIEKYRELATKEEVSNGIDIIVHEVVYTPDEDIVTVDIDEENDKIKEAITKKFERILDVINFDQNVYKIARQMYIDGQLNVALLYKNNNPKDGIQEAHILEPFNLYFDKNTRTWKYNKAREDYQETLYSVSELSNDEEYSEAELVHVDYDLYTKIRPKDAAGSLSSKSYVINLSYLENVFKTANMLETLENMLVPLRFNRSVSRRLFNVDMGDLPPKASKEAMNEIRKEFKYKKTYDPQTGTIKNIQNTHPLVEDYWFANRSGGKGTTLEVMDEKGALMDLEDIRHAARKLYQSMKIPSSRNPYSDDEPRFSFDNTEITQEELSFYIFISRIRKPIVELLQGILKRELIGTGVFTEQEWKNYEKKVKVRFTSDSIFLENMKNQMFLQAFENFNNIKEEIGKSVSLQTAVEFTFRWSSEQLREELEKIEEERTNPLYQIFYSKNDNDEDSRW